MRADHPSMRGRRLVAHRTTAPDGTAVLRVTGELDHDSLPDLRLALREAMAERPARLVVDLAAAWHVSALAGVAAVTYLTGLSRRFGVPAAVTRAPAELRRAVAETSLGPGAPRAEGVSSST